MTNLFESATFGTLCETRDGGRAVYLSHVKYNDTHKLFVQGFEYPLIYFSDGRRRGGGKYPNRYGADLDVIKLLN